MSIFKQLALNLILIDKDQSKGGIKSYCLIVVGCDEYRQRLVGGTVLCNWSDRADKIFLIFCLTNNLYQRIIRTTTKRLCCCK